MRAAGRVGVGGGGTHGFPEEDDVGFDEAAAPLVLAVEDLASLNGGAHARVVDLALAVDAALRRERAVRLDEARGRDARLALERVDVLREARVEEVAVREQLHEAVRERGPEAAGIELARERVDCR